MSDKNGGKEGFTLGLALMDAIPCIAFGIDMSLLAKPLSSPLFLLGAVVSLFAGLAMVFYKIMLAVFKKDYPVCKKIMPIGMTIGWLTMIIAAVINSSKINLGAIWKAVSTAPAVIFFIAGIVAFIAFFTYFKTKFNADSAKDNWVEEILNAITQVCILLGVVFATM